MIRGVCFDLFHTLVDVWQVPGTVGGFTADILGVDRRRWSEACFGPLHDICRPTDALDTLRCLAHSIDPDVPEERIRAAAVDRQRRFDHCLRHPPAESVAALEALRARGLRLALVSNASSAEVAAWEHSPLAGLFDAAVFSCYCGSRKPEPAIYHTALKALGLAASECLFVGDGGSDEHRGARALGFTTVLTTRFTDGRLAPEAIAERRAACVHEVQEVGQVNALLARIEAQGGGEE